MNIKGYEVDIYYYNNVYSERRKKNKTIKNNCIKQMIDLNVHRKYNCETGKSEYQCHMEWLRGLLINMQEIGVAPEGNTEGVKTILGQNYQ